MEGGGSGGKKVLTLKKEILEGNTNLPPLPPLPPLDNRTVFCNLIKRVETNRQLNGKAY